MPVWINVTTLSCPFSVSLSGFWFFVVSFFFLNRQPPRSPGKVSFTPQRKSPSSMIARAYHKTLDKCQRGLRGGDQEDIWGRDRSPLTVAYVHTLTHTHTQKHWYIHTQHQVEQNSLKKPHRTEGSVVHHTQTFNFRAVRLTPYIFIQYSLITLNVHVLSR